MRNTGRSRAALALVFALAATPTLSQSARPVRAAAPPPAEPVPEPAPPPSRTAPPVARRAIPPSVPTEGRAEPAPAPPQGRPTAPPDELALLARMGGATPGASSPLLGSLRGVNAAVLDDTVNPGGFRCASDARGRDSVRLVDAGAYYLLSFSCRGGASAGQPVAGDVRTVSLAFKRGFGGAFAPGAGPRQLLPGDPGLRSEASRARAEAETCLNAFEAYRSGGATTNFRLTVVGGYARCSTGAWVKPLTVTPAPILVPELVSPIVKFGPYRADKTPDNLLVYSLEPVLWRNDWSTPTLAAVTAGPPKFNRIYFQTFKPTANLLSPGCKNWAGLTSPSIDVSARPANQIEIKQLGLEEIADPHIIVFQVPENALKQLTIVAAGATSLAYRLAPVAASGGVANCAGLPTGPMALELGASPSQIGSAQVAAAVSAAAAKSEAAQLAAQKAAKARDAFFGPGGAASRSPVTVSLAGWAPPFGTPGAKVSRMTSVPCGVLGGCPAPMKSTDRRSVFPMQAAMPGIEWPEQDNWSEGCVFDAYYFVQAAQHKANPNTVWDWITSTVNHWAAAWAGLQSFVVEGFAYLASGGECDVLASAGSSQPAACKPFKSGLSTVLKSAMSAVGLPPALPTSNNAIEYASTYVASTAMSAGFDAAASAGAGDVVAAVPDSARQAAVDSLSKKLSKAAGAAQCAQPLEPGQDPKSQGYDGVDPTTLCGFKSKSPYNYVRFDAWPSGHPESGLAWVKVMPNPKGLLLNAQVRIQLSTQYVEGPKGATPAMLAALPGYTTPFASPAPVILDVRNIPPQGLYVPIYVNYDRTLWQFSMRKTPTCGQNAFEPQCVEDNAWSAWHSMNYARAGKVSIDVTYTWTQDAQTYSASVPVKDAKGSTVLVWASADGGDKAKYVADQAVGPLGRVLPGRTYGIPAYKACPGFQLAPADPKTGLQDGSVIPSFDMNSL